MRHHVSSLRSLLALAAAAALAALASVTSVACDDTEPAPMRVSVLKFVAAEQCWVLLTPAAPVDPALGSTDPLCQGNAPATLVAGTDRARLVVDYGPDVHFADTTVVPAPIVIMTVDGVETPSGIQLMLQPLVDGRAWFVGELTPPARAGAQLGFLVEAAPGFATRVPPLPALAAPRPEILVQQCPAGAACELSAGVGTAVVQVQVPGSTPQEVTLTSTLDNVRQEQVLPVTVDVATEDGRMEGFAHVPVPIAPDGTAWAITAQLGTARATTPAITLRAPLITASIDCGTPCIVTAGSSVGLAITAPRGIRNPVAIYSTTVDGAPSIPEATLNLINEDLMKQTIFAVQGLPVPDAPGAIWKIDILVSGYPASSIIADIQAPAAR